MLNINILNIIKKINLNIDINELCNLKEDNQNFFNYLFKSISISDLDNLINYLILENKFSKVLYSYFHYISLRVNPDISSNLFKYLIESGYNPHQLIESININSSNLEQYKRMVNYLKNNVIPYNNQFEYENKILYNLKEKLEDKHNLYAGDSFEKQIIIPLSRENGNNYLEYILKKLNFNETHIDIMQNGTGSTSWCFKLSNDLVLKFSASIATWNIPMFYRINDFIIRRPFNNNVITVCPYGDINSVTNEDIHNALNDFDKAGIVLTDGNYPSNFAIVNYQIPNSMFTDVCGITKQLDITPSDSFSKRKVKLIDQDYIYTKDQTITKYGLKPIFK